MLLYTLDIGMSLITIDYISLIVSVIVGGLLLKTTIAIHGMEKHAKSVLKSLDDDNLDMARTHLSMIVKTKYQKFRQKSCYFRRVREHK